MNHCLETGGKHVEPTHFRLMVNCAEICRTAADFMLSNSNLHARICAACAEVCDACGTFAKTCPPKLHFGGHFGHRVRC